MDEFFNAVREACSAGIWSRGVELVRADAVSGDRESEGEVQLRVATRGGLISPTVILYLEDEDWECSCSSPESACEHIAAAAIALRRARKEGKALPAPEGSSGRLRYRFRRCPGGLELEREIVEGEAVHRLTTTLDAIASGRVDGPAFAADQRDLKTEVTLGSHRHGLLRRELMTRLADCLSGADNVLLEDEPVQVSAEPILPIGRLEDAPGGFRLSLQQDPSVSELFENGSALCGDTLRVLGSSRLSGRELHDLPEGRFYSHDQVAELVTEVLPSLEERIPVEIRSERLPSTTESARPRIQVQVSREADRLCVLPVLVYGDPPSARIDRGELVHLGGAIPVRDTVAERREVRRLSEGLGLSPGHKAELRGEEAVAMAERLAGWRGELEGEAHRAFHLAPPLEPRIRIEGSRLELSFESPASDTEATGSPRRGGGRADSEAVFAAWNESASLVALDGGGFAPLPADWLERFGHRVADLLAARDADGELPACTLPALALLCDELDCARPPALAGLAPLLEDFRGIPAAQLPDDLTATLRPYQRAGVDWLHFLREARLGALLADDMGLGKTLQALCSVRGRTLVVTPTSVLHTWADELRRFRPALDFEIFHGARRELPERVGLVLTSYAILRLDIDRLAALDWDTVVLDEAQNIKNPDSQVAQAAFSLRADFRMALTGTPVENRLDELWSQFHFLNRGLLGGRRDFQARTTRPISDGDAEAAQRLRERLRPFLLRRLKRDVAPELPPRVEIVLHVELSEAEREVYDAVRAASVARAVEQLRAGGGVMEALEALLRLRQAACHSGLVPGQSAETSSKTSTLVTRLEQAAEDGHRALVFSQWTQMLDRLEPHLRAADLPFERLDGSTRDRSGVVARFQSETGPPVMLVSLKAGGTGLTLTAADHIFLMDPWWNPAVEDQAADRAHRIGQTRAVLIHRLVALDTVEERILELHTAKRALSQMALEEAGQSGGLSSDDLLGLLSDG